MQTAKRLPAALFRAKGRKRMKQYTVREDTVEREETGSFTSYGLDVLDETGTCTYSVQDITTDRAALAHFAAACNSLQPSQVHLNEIIEDFLAVCP